MLTQFLSRNLWKFAIYLSVGLVSYVALSIYFSVDNSMCKDFDTDERNDGVDDISTERLNSDMRDSLVLPITSEVRTPMESEEKLRSKMSSLRLKCNCPEPPDWLKPVNKRRIEEGKKWQRWKDKRRQPLSVCKAMSPLYYIGSGITVEPYQTVRIVGLSLHPMAEAIYKHIDADIVLKVSSARRLGVPHIPDDLLETDKTLSHLVNDGGYSILINFKRDIELLKRALDNLQYTSDRFEMDATDKLQITIFNFTIDVYIHVLRQPLPDLYDPGENNDIADKVTVITKTFERPDVLETFIGNIHRFYPDVTIIVADDSRNPKPINKTNVKHFVMPYREGCFPGRNLALSQVRTKFVVFLDDDFMFTDETNLQNMVDKLEDENIDMDIVAGFVREFAYIIKGLRRIAYNDTQGYCNLGPTRPKNREVPGYPQCEWGEMFHNFFMAKTAVLRSIGFYPQIVQAAHEEFWVDAIGKAKSAFCSDSAVTHKQARNENYDELRAETGQLLAKNPMSLFENNACYWWVLYRFPNVTDRSDLLV